MGTARAGCVLVGVLYPVWCTLKAIAQSRPEEKTINDEHRKSQLSQHKWLTYWSVYGTFNVIELVLNRLLQLFPWYHTVKLFSLLWLMSPRFEGAIYLYLSQDPPAEAGQTRFSEPRYASPAQ